jgi:hypothetical protein
VPKKPQIRSFVKSGEALHLAKKLRVLVERAGYHAMPIDEHRSGIRAGRFPPGTLAFAVVDRGPPPRFPGSIIVDPGGGIAVEGDSYRELLDVLGL